MKIAVVQNSDCTFRRLAELTMINKAEYCSRHGYEFIPLEYELPAGDDWYWHNIRAIIHVIENNLTGADWLFWTDVDSIITDVEYPLEMFLDVDDSVLAVASLWSVPHDYILSDLHGHIQLHEVVPGTGIQHQIHTGNFFVRNCQSAADMLTIPYKDQRFRDRPELIERAAGDEGALAVYYMAYPEYRRYWQMYHPSRLCTVPVGHHSYNTHIMRIPESVPEWEAGHFILHALGRFEEPTIEEWKIEKLKPYLGGKYENGIVPDTTTD